ncbi:aconitate hydratase AcnA [Microbacteriaceae bacterium K1510]|nr:aconitate hydratase AcnA [Microbacteriaceae bacterium K1510]
MDVYFRRLEAESTTRFLKLGGMEFRYFSLKAAEAGGLDGVSRLPKCLKVLLENQIRLLAQGRARSDDVQAFTAWLRKKRSSHEIGFRPTRVMMPESGGLPLLGDLAAMRDAAARLGGVPSHINPVVPVDFIVDHSIMVDVSGVPDAAEQNHAMEIERNRERFEFLKWGSAAFANLRVVPPGMGICHQINLEYLAHVVWSERAGDACWAYPDTVLGMDSHTPMINGLGIVGWGVGGIEAGSAALGEPVSLLVPEVYGCKLVGRPKAGVTATDIVLTLTRDLRKRELVGKFVEFFGAGVDELSLADRATISNMAPEYGATMSFFPVDSETVRYLRLTGRKDSLIELVERYCKEQGLWRDEAEPPPEFSEIFEFDLSTVERSVAGPRQPYEQLPLSAVPKAVLESEKRKRSISVGEQGFALSDGAVVIAAITSCTNTSNPAMVVAAGLLARNAVRRGLQVKPWVKTSFSPGSRTVTSYLNKSGLQEYLDALGFNLTGYGCMSCMGNSGPLDGRVAKAIAEANLTVAAVLSGNRNYEGRVHPAARANFLASPPLVVAYALAGSVNEDLTSASLGNDRTGQPVYLSEVWPSSAEINQCIEESLDAETFRERYASILNGTPGWKAISAAAGDQFKWDDASTYIRRPPFFDDIGRDLTSQTDISGARILGIFGDALSTDHISPIGIIPKESAAGRYLSSLGIASCDFNSYASRRLNDRVMVRGTFGNPRIRNEMLPDKEGSWTVYQPTGEQMPIFEAVQLYQGSGTSLIIIAGKRYGAGSSRDWAAKGPRLLGVRAVIAESFERIHRSNLAGIGVLPLEFPEGVTRKSLKLAGGETIDIDGLNNLSPRGELLCRIMRNDSSSETVLLRVRLDTPSEVSYYKNGGILHHALRSRL